MSPGYAFHGKTSTAENLCSRFRAICLHSCDLFGSEELEIPWVEQVMIWGTNPGRAE